MRAEIFCTGKVVAAGRSVAWKSYCDNPTYNQGGTVQFRWAGKTRYYKIDIYGAQNADRCAETVKRIIENQLVS